VSFYVWKELVASSKLANGIGEKLVGIRKHLQKTSEKIYEILYNLSKNIEKITTLGT